MVRASWIRANSWSSLPWFGATWIAGRPAAVLDSSAAVRAGSGGTNRSVKYRSTAVHCSCDMRTFRSPGFVGRGESSDRHPRRARLDEDSQSPAPGLLLLGAHDPEDRGPP